MLGHYTTAPGLLIGALWRRFSRGYDDSRDGGCCQPLSATNFPGRPVSLYRFSSLGNVGDLRWELWLWLLVGYNVA